MSNDKYEEAITEAEQASLGRRHTMWDLHSATALLLCLMSWFLAGSPEEAAQERGSQQVTQQ